ncbi:hypothetical protein [Enterobacter cloacae complex sp. CDL008]|uniref:ParE family toxin-like protein n=1 Tax=unclassified Enterobacter cloacae complex TaxID=2757714 RepID=UPI003BA80315
MQVKVSLTRHFQCCQNTTVAKRIKPHHYFSVHVSYRWRLLSKDKGRHWELMTHERYNKQYRI